MSFAHPAPRLSSPSSVVAPCNESGFASYWSGGFEGADHVNGDGIALDLNVLTGHAAQLRGDYRRARAAGMCTVRESVGWRVCTHGARCDFTRAEAMARQAARQRMEVAWTLWHYGFPRDVDPFAPSMPERFAEFADAFARTLGPVVGTRPWVNPVNEISFLTWLLTETAAIHPFRGNLRERAAELKCNLARAAIAACAAVSARIPGARFFHTDPLIHVAAPEGSAELAALALRDTEAQFEAWKLLAAPDFVPAVPVHRRFDLVGVNYYHSSQWEAGTRRPLHWHLRDPRRAVAARSVARPCARYRPSRGDLRDEPCRLRTRGVDARGARRRASYWPRRRLRRRMPVSRSSIARLGCAVPLAPQRPVGCRSARTPRACAASRTARHSLRCAPHGNGWPGPMPCTCAAGAAPKAAERSPP